MSSPLPLNDRKISQAAQVFADAQHKARLANLKRGHADKSANEETEERELSRLEQVQLAQRRFEGLSRYEILADLDDMRKSAKREGQFKAALDISKYLLDALPKKPVADETESEPLTREEILAKMRKKESVEGE